MKKIKKYCIVPKGSFFVKGIPPENRAENLGKSKNSIIFENFHTQPAYRKHFPLQGDFGFASSAL
jgi:hypothetical protein